MSENYIDAGLDYSIYCVLLWLKTGYGLNVQHFRKNEECGVTEELEPIDTNMQYDFDYQVSMKCIITSLN